MDLLRKANLGRRGGGQTDGIIQDGAHLSSYINTPILTRLQNLNKYILWITWTPAFSTSARNRTLAKRPAFAT